VGLDLGGRGLALLGVAHVLLQQRFASLICYRRAERRQETEIAQLGGDFSRNGRRIAFRVASCLDPAQPVEILRREVRIRDPSS